MVSRNEAIKAADILQDYCGQWVDCYGCPFVKEANCGLKFTTPYKWHIPLPHRWTDKDVALASALIKNGYEMISSVNDSVFGITGRGADGIYLSNGTLFKSFKAGEIVMLEDIVKEGEQK